MMVGVEGLSVTSAHQITVQMDETIEKIDHDAYDMMILPGGPGTSRLGESKMLMEQLKKFKEQGKYLAAICAAPSILGQAGLLQGERATCYPGYEEQLIGAKVLPDEKVVVSGRIITAKGAGPALDFGFKLLELLKGEDVSKAIRRRMIAE